MANHWKIIIAAATVIVYYSVMRLKNMWLKNRSAEKVKFINFVFNILLLVAVLFISLLVSTDFDFRLLGEKLYNGIFNAKLIEIITGAGLVIIVSTTLYNTVKTIMLRPSNSKKDLSAEKRKATIIKVALSFIRYALYVADIVVILYILGIDITPVLTGLGLAGIVIGLGAQKLITDFINGVFIIFERHFDVGDIVEIQGFKGEIIDIGLKTTKIRNWMGDVKIVANGEILQLTNFSIFNSIAAVEFKVGYDTDFSRLIKILNDELPKRTQDNLDIIIPPAVNGVTSLNNESVTIRILATVKTEKQYPIERLIRLELVRIFQENNIDYPYYQIIINQGDHNGE